MLISPNDKKLKTRTLLTAVQEGKVGVSPKKKGRPRKIPAGFTKACVMHATMMQVSGETEASGAEMNAIIQALAHGTKWEGQLNAEYVWRSIRVKNPAILNPVQAKSHENWWVDWLTYSL